jgi:tetratricopeptide (TPR) repeat protein
MIGPEQLASGERAELAGDFLAAAAAYRAVTGVPDESLAAEAHFRLGRVCWKQGRFGPALAAFENARAVAERAGDSELIARVDNGIGAVHYALGDYTSARQAYDRALAGSTDIAMHGKIILNLGVIENILGNFDNALLHYERAQRLFEDSGDEGSATLALHNRGMVEADLKRWSDADRSFLRAIELATTMGNRELVARSLVNRTEVLIEHRAYDDAVDHCDQALIIYQDVSDEVGRGEALRWRSRARSARGESLEALADAEEALQIGVRSGARLLEAESARDLGLLRRALGDRPGATKDLNRAVALFTKLGATREADEVRSLLPRATPARSVARIPSDPSDDPAV